VAAGRRTWPLEIKVIAAMMETAKTTVTKNRLKRIYVFMYLSTPLLVMNGCANVKDLTPLGNWPFQCSTFQERQDFPR
jgi:hypothetical protein